MGGQACVFYGAAEFSRDVDLLIVADDSNLNRLRVALQELEAEPIAVPALEEGFLSGGHAVHFRCKRSDVAGLRIDLMARLRGAPTFAEMYSRRTTIQTGEQSIDLLGIEDLVMSKKTQRDKDWPMIRRLVEQNYFEKMGEASEANIEFWLRELRTPELLVEVSARWPAEAAKCAASRRAVEAAIGGDVGRVAANLEEEERQERELDRVYWEPLRRQLEQLRRRRNRS